MPQSQRTSQTRLIANLIIITLGLFSLILLRLEQRFFWLYTTLMPVVVALISVATGVYLSVKEKTGAKGTLWRQVLYWVGALAAIYVTVLMLNYGVTNKTQSGLFTLLLLAVVLYLIGISEDLTLTVVGITLGLMVTGTIIIRPYFLLVIIPIAIIMGLFIVLLTKRSNRD